MGFVDVLDWALDLFPRFGLFLLDLEITDGVSVISFIGALMIIGMVIYAFVPRP